MEGTTVVIVSDDRQGKLALQWADAITLSDRIYLFSPTTALRRVDEQPMTLTGPQWATQVAERLEKDYLKREWAPPVEIIILSVDKLLEGFYPLWQRLGFITQPVQGMTSEEFELWLKQRLSLLPSSP